MMECRRLTVRVLLPLILAGAVAAAPPPERMHYQGVLRDSADAPLDGSFDMAFRFFDAELGGNEILVDQHLAAGTGAVSASGGLFSVDLGGGNVLDGAAALPGDPYLALSDVFRDFSDVWVQIEIDPGGGFEVLSPRVAVEAAAYALNASHLNGRADSEFIDTSGAGQVKSGNLQIAELTLAGNKINFAAGSRIEGFGGILTLAGTDVRVQQDLDVDGNDITFGFPGAAIQVGTDQLLVQAGDQDGDDLVLQAGNEGTDGQIQLFGDGAMNLRAGNGTFQFIDGSTGGITAVLSPSGLFDLDGEMRLLGPLVFDSSGASIAPTGVSLIVQGGTVDGDDLFLQANDNTALGEIGILGGGEIFLTSGNGSFRFVNGANGTPTATLTPGGTFDLEGEMRLLGPLIFDSMSASIAPTGTSLIVQAGTADGDDLFLQANDNDTQGEIVIFGGGPMSLEAGNGSFSFVHGSAGVETATLAASGDLQFDGTLTAGSETVSAFHRFGTGTPESGAMTNANDLYVTADLEVDGLAYLNGTLHVDDNGPEGDQSVYFYEAGSATGEFIRWEDAADRFRISDELKLDAAEIEGRDGGNFEVVSLSSLHLVGVNEVRTMIDDSHTTTTATAEWFHDGSFANANKLGELQEDGDLRIAGTLSQSVAFDLAESFLAAEPLGPGDVVALDPTRPGAVRRSEGAADARVLGVVSTRPGLLLGSAPFHSAALRETWGETVAADFEALREGLRLNVLDAHPELQRAFEAPEEAQRIEALALERFFAERFVPVALAGRVPVNADASFGAIAPGDPLAPSPTPGVAMRADGSGPVIGIALASLPEGTGHVLAFVQRQSASIAVAAENDDEPGPAAEADLEPVTDGNPQIVLRHGAGDGARFSIFRGGETEGDLAAEVFRVDEQGNVYARGAFRPAAMDVAEYFRVSEPVETGDVLVVDPAAPGSYRRGSVAGDRAVVGVVSAAPGVVLGSGLDRIAAADPELSARLDAARRAGDDEEEAEIWRGLRERFERLHAPVALSGTVPCKVDAGYGAIRTGDLLMTSPTPGHAMRADDEARGTIVGKALEPLQSGTGAIRILVMLR